MKRISASLLIGLLITSPACILAQATIPLMEQRVEALKATTYLPMDPAKGAVAALRSKSTFYWAITPIIIQTWDMKVKALGLALRVTDLTTPPASVVFIIDGKPTMIQPTDWGTDEGGGQASIIEREDLVRSIATAKTVSITVFGTAPLTGTFQSSDLLFFQSLVSMYDAGTFVSPQLGDEKSASVPTPQTAPTSTAPIVAPSTPATPSGKLSRTDFLKSKVPEAATMCHDWIVATAKDPSSLQFADDYDYGFGRVISRNWIFITWSIMGRNTYGAVLHHTMTCTISCTQGKACTRNELQDEP